MFFFAFIAGVVLGGLLNVVIYRLPRLVPAESPPPQPSPAAAGEGVLPSLQIPPAAAGEGALALPILSDVRGEGGLPPPQPSPAAAGEGALPGLSREGRGVLPDGASGNTGYAALSTRHSAPSAQSAALHCTQSGEALTWRDSVPLLGWLGQRGRCRHCGKRLPRAFPLVEIFTGLTFAAAWIDFGASPQFYIYSLFALVLIVTMVIDWQHHDLYTIVLLAGAILALVGALLNPELDLTAALVGALVGGGTLLVFYLIARLAYGEEALAFGDVELALMLGLMVGYPSILGPLLLGPLIAGAAGVALVFVRRKGMHDYIPIGASFCFATICALLLRDQLWHTLPLDNLTYWLGVITDNIGKWLGGLISAR